MTGPGAPLLVRAAILLKAILIAALLPILGALLFAWLVDLVYRIPYPIRWRIAAAGTILFLLLSLFTFTARLLIIAVLLFFAMLLGLGISGLCASTDRPRRIFATILTLFGSLGLILAVAWFIWPGAALPAIPNAARLSGQPTSYITLPDPSQPGPYPVKTLTYGSGQHPFRPEFGTDADLQTDPVNGSKLLGSSLGQPSRFLRPLVWGFGFDALPLNALVWMPEGSPADGPYPLVLMAHGNHSMTEFSDPGYAYLAELLASHGMIFISVDQNFLNGGVTDIFDSPKNENDARAWLLLEHLRQWRDWNDDPASPFYQKVDLQRIALIGHSRGGEAAAVAAAFNRLPFYPDDASLTFDYDFGIRAVFAIAPIDGQYLPADHPTALTDVDYFVLQGSHDADVSSFDGLNQYRRVSFSPNTSSFKAALYIYRANHTQFNSLWGRRDYLGLTGGFLNRQALLPIDEQQQIAKVYLSAFLEASLNEQDGYRPLFQDARAAPAGWLPDTIYISRYDTASDLLLSDYESDVNLQTGTLPGSLIRAQNLDLWAERRISTRWGLTDNSAVFLGWNEQGAAQYTFNFPPLSPTLRPQDELFFALADAMRDPPPGHQPLDLTIILEDSGGQQAALPLSNRMPVQPQILAAVWKAPFLTAQSSSEPVLQNYAFPLREFLSTNPSLDLSHLSSIHFVFNRSPRGSLILDDIGFRYAK